MALTQRLGLRQSQSLVMTPQLQQAIKLLQFSQGELMEFVDQELEQNPLLERSTGEDDTLSEQEGSSPDGSPPEGPGTHDEAPTGNNEAPDWNSDDWRDAPGDYNRSSEISGNRSGLTPSYSHELPDIAETAAGSISLRDHLFEQINIDITDPRDRLIAGHMVDYLDEAGYLQSSLPDLAANLGCSVQRVEDLLDRIHRFDPPGIFARDLRECLLLQLKEAGRFDPAMEILLSNLTLLANGEIKQLRRLCGVDSEDFAEMLEELRALDPKPALAFDHVVTQAIQPDIFLNRARGRKGGWAVELNSDALPKAIVNDTYAARILSESTSKADREFIVDQLNSANWLIRSLQQRAETILKVSSEIVRRQSAFFDKGIEHLRPLILRDIAEAVDLHESTVSRATANKYMSTPRGLFELKYFFTSAISSSQGGEAHSAEAVRHKIRALIDAEPAKAILSDDKIVDLLRDEGVDIARRTVAKYRDAMRIPSSVQRRREKRALVK
jgi:RNA polymerase sigma-54 factor